MILFLAFIYFNHAECSKMSLADKCHMVSKILAEYEQVIGWPGVFGCGLFLLLIPVQLSFTSMFSKYRRQSAMYADQRVKLMREVIEGIRVIKMYVWEESFKRLIKKIRLLGTFIDEFICAECSLFLVSFY